MSSLSRSLVSNPELDTWIRVDPERTITVFTGKVELGQGLRSAIAVIAAEELDVSLGRVRVETADTARGPDEGYTAGSQSMSDSGTAVRQAAAEARAHLVQLAAAELDAAPSTLLVDDGTIVTGDGRSTTYWELLGGGRFGTPVTGHAEPKRPEEYRLVGRRRPRIDLAGLVTGTTRFVQDLQPPGTLHGRVVRPPSPAARLESVAEAPVRELPGVVQVVVDGSFLGVIAEREEQAIAAADALLTRARWVEEETLPVQRRLAEWLVDQPTRDFHVVDGVPVKGRIPPIEDPPDAAKTLEATFTRPYQMHASIGPAAALAEWTPEGTLTVWTAAQGVFFLRDALAQVLGLDREAVRAVHVEGPGCYGHNGSEDATLDAALLARAVPGRPVLTSWRREDEHSWEPYGPASVVKTRASLDANGRLLEWNLDVWGTTHNSRSYPHGERTALLAGWHLDPPVPRQSSKPVLQAESGLHRNATPLYAVPRMRIVKHFVENTPLRSSSMRALGAYANVFAIESFMDELAREAGIDPLEFRLAHLDDERARAVLAAASERAGARRGGGEAEFGRGRGIGFGRYKNRACYAAVVVDVLVDDETAEVRLERAVIAADAGQIVDPDGVVNQLEGGFVQAASWTLKEEVSFDSVRVTSTDWESYPILKFPEMPKIETVLLDRPGAPYLGVGEAAQGPTAGAIANAVAAAIGVRVRDIPFTPERLRAAVATV